jgi:hypothetical protein
VLRGSWFAVPVRSPDGVLGNFRDGTLLSYAYQVWPFMASLVQARQRRVLDAVADAGVFLEDGLLRPQVYG